MNNEKIFISGFYSKDVPDSAPEFILGQGALHVGKLAQWLQENENLADDRGYINYKILSSKSTGARYVEVDTWKPTKKVELSDEERVQMESDHNARLLQAEQQKDSKVVVIEGRTIDYGEVSPDNIPF